MIKELKAYIVEDNQENIEFLKLLIKGYIPSINIIGEAVNQEEFVDLLVEDQADVIFLDIELDEMKTSLEVLEDFGGTSAEIIVVSSSKEYVLNAINKHNDIVAYVLKPFNMIDLNRALIKAEKNIRKKLEIKTLASVKNDIIAIPNLESIEILKTEEIVYLEAAGKYTIFHLSDLSTRTVSKILGFYTQILPANVFFRIHNKFLINITETNKIYRTDGNYCELNNGKSLPIAKRYFEELRKYLYLK